MAGADAVRIANSLEFQLSDIWLWGLWRAGGNMLIGMALVKWRVVTAELPQNFYRDLAVIGFGFGLPLISGGVAQHERARLGNVLFVLHRRPVQYWASLLVASGWVGFTISLWHVGFARGLTARLIAVGRTAFSCYILTSLICTFVFYGHGLGFYGHVSRPGQLGVTLAVWITLLIAAPLWLERFRFGPLEWAVADVDVRRKVSPSGASAIPRATDPRCRWAPRETAAAVFLGPRLREPSLRATCCEAMLVGAML
jgi:uncharacterized protein